MTVRYAVYYAPPPETALWRFGSEVLGYDAASGLDIAPWQPPGRTPQAWAAMTADPRRYGFHATLKAPFRLAAGRDEAALARALERFCAGHPAVALGPCAVHEVPASGPGGFLAVTPEAPPPALAALEHAIVEGFEPFRAPLTDEERARRRPDRLSGRQRAYLDRYGYPFVLQEFRFHMSLTGLVEDPAALRPLLQDHAQACGAAGAILLDRLALFRQGEGGRFRVLLSVPLQAR